MTDFENRESDELKQDALEPNSLDEGVKPDEGEEVSFELSDKEKDLISKEVSPEASEEAENIEDEQEASSEQAEVDKKHIRHSAHEEEDNKFGEDIELERSKKMRVDMDASSEEESEEKPQEEIDEDELLEAELIAKKEAERQEKEYRQAQYRESHERALRYQEHARVANDEYHRSAQIRAANERDRLAAEEESKGLLEAEKEPPTSGEDDFADRYVKKLRDEQKDSSEDSSQNVRLEKDRDLDEKQRVAPKKAPKNITPFIPSTTQNNQVPESSNQGLNSVFETPMAQKNDKDLFSEEYAKRHIENLGKSTSVGVEKDRLLNDNLLDGNLKDFKVDKESAEEISGEISGQAQSIVKETGPTMGQDSPESTEAKRKSHAKKVAKSASKILQEGMGGEEVNIDGLQVKLSSETSDVNLSIPKGTSLNSLIGKAIDINDKKTSEDNARTALQSGATVASKSLKEGKLDDKAEALIEKVDQASDKKDSLTEGKNGSVRLSKENDIKNQAEKIKLTRGDVASDAGKEVQNSQSGTLNIKGQVGDGLKDSLSEHAGAVIAIAGELSKPTSSEDDKPMNPSSIAKSAKDVFAKGSDSIAFDTKGIEAKQLEKPIADKMKSAEAADGFGVKKTELDVVDKADGSLRMVRDGKSDVTKNIEADSPGLAKREANENLTKGKRIDPEKRLRQSKSASQEYEEATKKNDGVRLGRDGKPEEVSDVKDAPGSKLNNRPLGGKFKQDDLLGGKNSNINFGGERISVRGGGLVEQADATRESFRFMQKHAAKNGLNAIGQTSQGGVLAQALAKKAVATAAVTGVTAGGVAGSVAVVQRMAPSGDFSVVAASVYDSETDETPLTQDAVDMLQARFKAYSKLASGGTLSATELEKAGANHIPLVDVGVQKTYNGKPVSSSSTRFRFVDGDGNSISKEKFLLDDWSDLVFPSEGTVGGSFGSSNVGGGYSGVGTTSNTTTPGNTYPWGQCTWGCKQLAPWIPNYMGNANGWLDSARANGLETGTTPEVGAIAVFTGGGGGYGHVAYVSEIDGGKIKVLESNYGGSAYAADPRGIGEYRGWVEPGAIGITGYIYPPADIRNKQSNKPSGSSSSSSSNSSGTSGSNTSNTGAKKDENGQTQMDIMFNIVGALETGGQVYGQRNYANFINAELGAEVTATLGWSSFYGVHGKEYLQRFKQENPDLFNQLDQGGQVAPVLNIEWEASGWQANPTQKASIVDMLTTDQGKKLQDTMTAERLAKHWKKAASLYSDDMRAVAWYVNIAELAGEGVADPVFQSLGGNYDSDHIYNTIITTYNRGGATIGAPMYHRRHMLYKQWIEENYGPDEKVDLDNIEVTGAGRIDAGGTNPNSSADTRSGQTLLLKVILAMSAVGSHYGQPNNEEDYFKYVISVMDNAIKGKDGKGISVSYTEGEETATANVEFKVLSEPYALEKMDANFTSWDLTDENYGDFNPQAYLALPNDDFEEIFNVSLKPTALGSSSGGSGLPYVKWALEVAENPEHGYSQVNRQGNPDYDCSSFIWYALNQAGFDVGTWPFATPTMPSTLKAAGFEEYVITSIDDMQPGDILLRDGHTEIYLGDGKMVGAHADENGTIAGLQGGDQGISTMGGIGEISVVPTGAEGWTWGYRPPADYVADNSGDDASSNKAGVEFGPDGLLKEKASAQGQKVINLLFAIPGGKNGAHLHKEWGIDAEIDKLTTEEAIWTIHRIEGPGFGQSAAGWAGADTPASHQAFVKEQLERRFDGSVHKLLKAWGTFEYNGY